MVDEQHLAVDAECCVDAGPWIEHDGHDLAIRMVAAWDATHYAAETIAAWAERLARFTARRYGQA